MIIKKIIQNYIFTLLEINKILSHNSYMCKHQTHVAKMNVAVRGMRNCPKGFGLGGAEALGGGYLVIGSLGREEIFPPETQVRGVSSHLLKRRGHHGEFQIQMKGPGLHEASRYSPQECDSHQNDSLCHRYKLYNFLHLPSLLFTCLS